MQLKAVAVFMLMVFFSPLQAKETDLSGLSPKEVELYKKIANDLRCPTCTGLSTLQSSEPFSLQIRDAVVKKLKDLRGKSDSDKPDTVMNYFRDKYGIWILREPPKEGFHLVAWAIPGLMLLLGPFFIWFFVWRRRKTVESYGVRSADSILTEMEENLAKLR